ncbi:MAG: hypothetical protein WDO16_18795 [Bacteroidota bacterium]
MAGIYIHIPFCKQACHYCNFHFATSLRHKNELVAALLKEMELRKEYLEKEVVGDDLFWRRHSFFTADRGAEMAD